MARKSLATMLKNWQDGMASPSASTNYKDGVNRVITSPMAAAADKVQEAAASYTRVVTSDDHVAMMKALPLSGWKSQCVAMAGRLADGAKKASPKYNAFLAKFGGQGAVWDQMKMATQAIGGSGIAAAKEKSAAALEILMSAGKKHGAGYAS